VDIESVVDELYSLPREQFVAVRNERAKQARSHGDRALAADIAALRKPSTAAWLVNEVTRVRPDSVRRLVRLADEMRVAHERRNGDTLRRLSEQRRAGIRDMLACIESLAGEHGTLASAQVLDEIQNAVSAALADAEASAQLLSGHLSALPHPAPGGEEWLTAGAAATPPAAEKPRDRSGARPAQRGRDDQRKAVSEELAAARTELDHAEDGVRKAAEAVRQSRKELERAQQDHQQARQRRKRARQRYEAASDRARSVVGPDRR
jgi:hypothetical protein